MYVYAHTQIISESNIKVSSLPYMILGDLSKIPQTQHSSYTAVRLKKKFIS